MVNENTRGGLIVAQASEATERLHELVALSEWPLLLRPSVRVLLQHIDACRPACLLFWLETANDIASTAEIVARLRDRGPRPYRIALAHSLKPNIEETFRAAGVHSYFAVNGSLHSLYHEALLPFVESQRVTGGREHADQALEGPVSIRAPTKTRGSAAAMRPP